MVVAELRISGRRNKEIYREEIQLRSGRWCSVGHSHLCDHHNPVLSPGENLQVNHQFPLVAIRTSVKVRLGMTLVTIRTKRSMDVSLVLPERRADDFVEHLVCLFPHYSWIYLHPQYDVWREEVIGEFPLQDLSLQNASGVFAALVEAINQRLAQHESDQAPSFEFLWSLALALFADFVLEGPLTGLLKMKGVNEIVFNGSQLRVERDGTWSQDVFPFSSWQKFESWLLFKATHARSELYRGKGFSDFTLPSGARVHVALPPISRGEGCVTIRSHLKNPLTFDELTHSGFLSSEEQIRVMRAVQDRMNILIVGATSSGKTTLLRSLASHCSHNDRLIVLEDIPELKIEHPHVLYLQTLSSSALSEGVDLELLVRESLRMRPDRLIVGECRGGEAFALLQALHTGHRGSFCTIHGNSISDALDRFQTLIQRAEPSLSADVARKMILSSIDTVLFVKRDAYGRRFLADIRSLRGGVEDALHG